MDQGFFIRSRLPFSYLGQNRNGLLLSAPLSLEKGNNKPVFILIRLTSNLVVQSIGLVMETVSQTKSGVALKRLQRVVVDNNQIDVLFCCFRNFVYYLVLLSQPSLSFLTRFDYTGQGLLSGGSVVLMAQHQIFVKASCFCSHRFVQGFFHHLPQVDIQLTQEILKLFS